MTALTPAQDAALTYLEFPGHLARTGWTPPPAELTFTEWCDMGTLFRAIEESLRLWWGDWLNYGEQRFPDRYTQALDGSGYAYGSLANAAWITDRVPRSLRSESLGIGHYQEVAPLKTLEERGAWLAQAEAEGWSVRELRKAIKSSNSREPQTTIVTCTLCGGTGYLEKVVE